MARTTDKFPCIKCGSGDNRVIDSRPAHGAKQVRRRRVCLGCGERWPTYECTIDRMTGILSRDEVEAMRVELLALRLRCDRLLGFLPATEAVEDDESSDAVERMMEEAEAKGLADSNFRNGRQ